MGKRRQRDILFVAEDDSDSMKNQRPAKKGKTSLLVIVFAAVTVSLLEMLIGGCTVSYENRFDSFTQAERTISSTNR